MDEINRNDYWIDAYLEWMNLEGRAIEARTPADCRIANAGAGAGVEFPLAYLELMDEAQKARESSPRRYVDALVALLGRTGDTNELDASSETALLAALRTRAGARAHAEPQFSN